jgi:hypothetical protein
VAPCHARGSQVNDRFRAVTGFPKLSHLHCRPIRPNRAL